MADLTVRRTGSVDLWLLARATVVAAVVGLAANAVLYLLAVGGGLVDERVALPSLLGMGPLSLASVSLTTLAATVAAGIVLAAFFATTRRPVRIFRTVATVLALASLAMPLTIPGPPPAMRLTMGAFHIVVWSVSVGVLATLAGRDKEGGHEQLPTQ